MIIRGTYFSQVVLTDFNKTLIMYLTYLLVLTTSRISTGNFIFLNFCTKIKGTIFSFFASLTSWDSIFIISFPTSHFCFQRTRMNFEICPYSNNHTIRPILSLVIKFVITRTSHLVASNAMKSTATFRRVLYGAVNTSLLQLGIEVSSGLYSYNKLIYMRDSISIRVRHLHSATQRGANKCTEESIEWENPSTWKTN